MKKATTILLSNLLVLMSGLGFSQSVPSYVPTNGLVGWWGFNGNAQDGSGNGNHGTVNGATLTTDRFGNQNGAYDFDGIDDWIYIANSSLVSGNQLTVSCWVRYNAGNYGHIISTGNQNDYLISQDNSTTVNTFVYASNSLPTIIAHNVPNSNNIWRHILMTYDGMALKTYTNGTLIAVDNASGNIYSWQPDHLTFGTYNLYGTPYTSAMHQFYYGNIDDIGIWNRALTQQEITNLYNSQLPTQTSLCLPTITTSSPSSVGVDTVVIGGDISNDGGSSIVLRGVCYSPSPNPNMGNQRTEDGSGIGSYNTVLRGLTSSTTYYARSYAKNSNGVVVYGNEVSFTTSASLPGLRCPGTPTVTDIDGNIYNTVQIGTQCWTQSNLKVSKYRNGDNIPTGLNNSQWSSTSSGAYAIYNNDPVNDGLYGKLYNHYAGTDSRGLCPTGWHVPSDGEWNVLMKFLDPNADTANSSWYSSTEGGSLKSTTTQPTFGGWNPPNMGATNSSGFTALPGGVNDGFGYFYNIANIGFWWSTSVSSGAAARSRYLSNSNSDFIRTDFPSSGGLSVRCLKNTLPQVNTTSVTNVTPSSALVTGEVISEGGDQNTTRGFCYSTASNPTLSNDTTMNGTGTGVYSNTLQNLAPSTTYYVRAYATNSVGTSYGNEVSFTTDSLPGVRCPGTPTVTDIDGNTYYTVQIGNQCWTQSNLKVSKYRNGDNIPTGLSNSDWSNTTSGAYAIYNNDPVNDGLFGKLYNHYAVTDSRGLCPTGWHVPSDTDWTILENHLGGSSVAGGALKSTAMVPTPGGWVSPNTGATNSSGFIALPGGLRNNNGDFNYMTYYGFWWSSSVSSASSAWFRDLNFNDSSVGRYNYGYRSFGFSVRCCRD